MVKRKSGGHGSHPRRRPGPSRPTTRAPRDEGPEHLQLFQDLRRSMRSDDPLDLLALVSSIVVAADPARNNPFARSEPQDQLATLVDSFLGASYAETTAALTVLRAVLPDEVMGARIARELANRRHPMPGWLRGLDRARIEPDVWFLTHVLGDGDDYLFGVSLPSGQGISALVYVDHNLGTVVKDAFIVTEPLEDLALRVGTSLTDPDQSLTRTDPATARAMMEQAIASGARTYPPLESESWPACRPLVEWMLRMLPTGGVLPDRKEWTPEETAAIADDFFASPFGSTIEGPDERRLLDSILWFGTDYTAGDPYRWSPVTVELLLVDWFPRKVVADPAYLAKLPEVLRGYIRYCHDRQGIRASLTRETLAAVEQFEPDYQVAIRSDRLQGPAALLEGMFPADEDDPTIAEIVLQGLDRAVGGRTRLLDLDAEPLPDEEFEWAGVPEDIRPVVQQVLDLCDGCAAELLDVEHRTAMRRFLSRAAVGDPAIFRRRASTARAAAAVAWVIGRANQIMGGYDGLTTKELLAHFGLEGSVSQRAEPMLRANGVDPYRLYGSMDLGAPDLLTSKRRAAIIERRDFQLAQ